MRNLNKVFRLQRAETLFRPYNGANVGGHASQRDTCHLCTTYALLRRWERLRVGERSSGMASPPTLPPMRCCDAGKRRLLRCHVFAVATPGKATGRRVSGNGVASYM